MKKSVVLLIIIVLAGGCFFALEHPNNSAVVKVKNLVGADLQSTGMQFTWLTDTGETLPSDVTPSSSQHTPATACTLDYTPVCAKVQVECIKAPCYPIQQTFGNRCQMNANPLATFLYTGECQKAGDIGLANPASVHCEDNGWTLDIRTDANGGQYGVCVFTGGKECEERAFFRGECTK